MFTGIIESTGLVKEVISNKSNKTFWIESPLSAGFKIDQSVSHNGVCLTVEEIKENCHRVTAIAETLKKTNLDQCRTGQLVNLEQGLLLNSRLDGHLVQGHADCTGKCISVDEMNGNRELEIQFPRKFAMLIVDKGSICVNGISLTAFDVKKKTFRVAIIPMTLERTNIREIGKGDEVNLEFDIVGKYIMRKEELS